MTGASAWREYVSGLEEVRQMIFQHAYAARAQDRAGALYLFQQIQAVAFNRMVAPNTSYPRFYLHGQLEPMTYSMGGGCADIQYRQAFIDGANRYRIWGRRGSAYLSVLQIMDGYWGQGASAIPTRAHPLDTFRIERDGAFEIRVSSEHQPGNWMKSDPLAHKTCLFFREVFADWDREQPSEIHIAPEDIDLDAAVLPSESDMAGRLRGAIEFMKEFVGRYSQSMIEDVVEKAGYNTVVPDRTAWPGANAASSYFFLAHKLAMDEALVITLDWAGVPYWSAQVTDAWHQTCEPIYHQSSLNNVQAQSDSDGKCRLVLCLRDPGIQNWLDPAGHGYGFVEFRVIPARSVAVPTADKITLAELGSRLPASPAFGREHRTEWLRRRRDAAIRRWGY